MMGQLWGRRAAIPAVVQLGVAGPFANEDGHHRQELVQWLNSLLQLNITKVEQCGTGYVASEKPSKAYAAARC